MVTRRKISAPTTGTGPDRSAAPVRHCDVAIAGAGVGGLTAAAILSQAGLDVVVLEAQAEAGGYLASFRRGDFIFDTSIQWLNQCHSTGFVKRIHDYLGIDLPPCTALRRIYRYKSADYDYVLTSNPQELRDQLMRDFPGDADAIEFLFAEGARVGQHLRILDDRMRSTFTMTTAQKIRRGIVMTRWLWPLRKYATIKASTGLARRFKSSHLRDLLYSRDSMLSVLIPIGLAFASNFQAAPAGGCSVIIQRLCDAITRHGGEIHCSSPVSDIVLDEHRQASGVRLEDGRIITADYVIAACDPLRFFEKLESGIPALRRMLGHSNETDLYYSSFSIYLGLDCPSSELGMDEAIVYLFGSSRQASERSYDDPRSTLISVMAPSQRDTSLAPPGKGTLHLQSPALLSYCDGWETGDNFERNAAYKSCKAKFAAVLLDRVERDLLPGLRSHIEVMTVATPITFMRYTGNRLGTIMGHRACRRNIQARVAGIRTPVRHLLLGGHWGEYGGGVPMATKAATNASLIILQAMRPTSAKSLEAVLRGTAISH